jgi:hypothetical protein
MYALRRGVDGLSAGTRVSLLSSPTVNPVRVRTLSKVPTMMHRSWFDQNGQQHHEAINIGGGYVEVLVPFDNLVKLRERSR